MTPMDGLDQYSVDVTDVSVDYPIYSAGGRSLKRAIARTIGGRIGLDANHKVTVTALEKVSLSLRSGDRLGILGGNGSGKSTLLRVMAGIFEPPAGMVRIRGHVCALLDFSLGMDLEATGYENILMRSVFLGASFAEARARVLEIEAFSELGEYLAFPLRTYSSGMIARLSFSISTVMRPEILVIDEFMGAADASFGRKAKARIVELVEHSSILAFATHDLHAAREFCTRGIVLDQGRVQFEGRIEDAIDAYQSSTAA